MQRISSNVIQLYDQYYCPKGVAVSAIMAERRILVLAYVFKPSVTLHILHQNNCHSFFAVSRISKHLIALAELLFSKAAYQKTISRTIFIDAATLLPTADIVRHLLLQATSVWDTDAPVFTAENLPVHHVAPLNTFKNFYKPEAIEEMDLSDGWEITDTLMTGIVLAHPDWMKPWLNVLSSKRDVTFYINHAPDAMFTCHNAACAGMSTVKFTCYQGHNICAKCLDCYVQAYCLALTECIERPELLTMPCPSVPPMTCPGQGCVQHINTDILMTLTKNKKQETTIKSLQQTFSKYFCK